MLQSDSAKQTTLNEVKAQKRFHPHIKLKRNVISINFHLLQEVIIICVVKFVQLGENST